MVGDGEDPGAEATLLTFEPGDVARDLKEGLAEDILRIGSTVGAQVSEDDRGEIVVELLPGGLAPLPGRLQERGESLGRHPVATVPGSPGINGPTSAASRSNLQVVCQTPQTPLESPAAARRRPGPRARP